MVVAPHLDGVFITLARARFRFLSTVLDGLEEATAMGRMIAHAKLALDHLGDSCSGPDLPAEPERFCSPGQQFRQLRPLLWAQFRRSARRGLMAQGVFSMSFAFGDPLAHRSFGDPQGCGNIFVFPSLLVQFPGAQPSSFAPILWKWCACVHTSFYRLFSYKL